MEKGDSVSKIEKGLKLFGIISILVWCVAATTTPYLGLVKPGVGEEWATPWHDNADAIDTFYNSYTTHVGGNQHIDWTNSTDVFKLSSAGDTLIDVISTDNYAQIKVADPGGTLYIATNNGSYSLKMGTDTIYLTDGNIDTTGETIRIRTSFTPASSSASGNAGTFCSDSSYLYRHDGTQWKRIAWQTF